MRAGVDSSACTCVLTLIDDAPHSRVWLVLRWFAFCQWAVVGVMIAGPRSGRVEQPGLSTFIFTVTGVGQCLSCFVAQLPSGTSSSP